MSMFKIIRNLLIIIIVFGILTALIDYVRMTTGNVPIFNISSYSFHLRSCSHVACCPVCFCCKAY